ncbi:hypothetical protein ACWGLE_31825 [Streptomyces sp. NPDC055897]
MDWIRFPKADETGRHYFQNYSVPQRWNAATPKEFGTGRISEAAALAYSIISPAGFQWRTECHCCDCTIAARSAHSARP